MLIRYLRISNFRGFERLEIKPQGHVLIVGEPGAGRSDVIEAIWRVLSPDSSRLAFSDDLDFFNRDLQRRIEIEVVLGALGPDLEQAFMDRLELWNLDASELVDEITAESDKGKDAYENVVRLCYRAAWDSEQQEAQQWVDFPKFSDPEGEDFFRVLRTLREELPVAFVSSRVLPLSLGNRGDFRRLIDGQVDKDFSATLDTLMGGVSQLAQDIVKSKDLVNVLALILEPLRAPLNLRDRPAGEIVQFAPEGGSLGGVLRGLQPTIKLRESLGFLPLGRHGSTLASMLQVSRAFAERQGHDGIVVLDDFGENMDVDAAQHLALCLRMSTEQLWLSTRRGAVGQCFRPEELVRLSTNDAGVRSVHIGRIPTSRAERLASRHLHLQILPAASSKTVVIFEGTHDRSAISAAASKITEEENQAHPSSQRISFIDAGAADGSGGIEAIPRLAQLAGSLGFHVISIVDWDRDPKTAEARLKRVESISNIVIRWPRGFAIEKALLTGLDDKVIQNAILETSNALSVALSFNPKSASGNALLEHAIGFLKSSGGLHAPFVNALPNKVIPPLLRQCLTEILSATNKSGLIQL